MRYLKLNPDGTIEAILSERPDGDYVLRKVPDDYPEMVDWDASEVKFKPSRAKCIQALRLKRDELLSETDWTEYSRKLTPEKKAQWLAYRDQLFDLPQTVTDPFNVQWPTAPE